MSSKEDAELERSGQVSYQDMNNLVIKQGARIKELETELELAKLVEKNEAYENYAKELKADLKLIKQAEKDEAYENYVAELEDLLRYLHGISTGLVRLKIGEALGIKEHERTHTD